MRLLPLFLLLTVTSAFPQANVLLAPTRTQTVTQPLAGTPGVETSLFSSSIKNVINPTVAPYNAGADIGAWINAAATALPASGGAIYIPAPVPGSPACSTFSTQIVLPPYVSLYGAGAEATCLEYTGTSGVALTLQSSATLAEIALIGVSGSSATGLLVKGNSSLVSHIRIGAVGYPFDVGLTFGDNTYSDRFVGLLLLGNTQDVLYPSGLVNSGEELSFISSNISGGGTFTNCFQNGVPGSPGGEFEFTSTSFDECQIVNNEGIVKLNGGHFEDGGSASKHPFVVTYSSSLDGTPGVPTGTFLNNPTVIVDAASPTGDGLFEVDKFGSMYLGGVVDTTPTSMPLVYLGAASGDGPFLKFYDSIDQRTQAQIYTIASGVLPRLDISTPTVQLHTASTPQVFPFSSPAYPYGHNFATIFDTSTYGAYQWTGSGSSWYGEELRIDGGNGFVICGAGAFTFSGYAALGSETETCGTKLDNTTTTTGSSIVTGSYFVAGANQATMRDVSGAAYIDSAGPNTSTLGSIDFRVHSSDDSLAATYMVLGSGAATFTTPILVPSASLGSSSQATVDTSGNIATSGTVSGVGLTDTGTSNLKQQIGPATAPSGSCSPNGAWTFSQDGHATFCSRGTWTTKI